MTMRLDLVIFDKSDKSCLIMDVVIPKDGRMRLRKKRRKSLKVSRHCERSSKNVGY